MNALSHFTPSEQQARVIDWVAHGRGSAFVEAVAGAGKTTTLVEALKQTRGSVAFAAFNKKIAEEIRRKVQKEVDEGRCSYDIFKRVRIGTFHSFGNSAWCYANKSAKLDVKGKRQAVDAELKRVGCPSKHLDIVDQLIGLAKQRALGVMGSDMDESLWWDIVDHFDLTHEVNDPNDLPEIIGYSQRGLKIHRKLADKLINFDDMIYMPVVSGVKMWGNDWVFTDEAQDTNPARRALARKMLKPEGRSVWVGDRRQCIYGFSGADSDAVDQIIKEFHCVELPLTITFRCPKSVVTQAQTIVDHIEAHVSAPEGVVRTQQFEDFNKEEFGPTDAILCRNTKPLVQTAYRLIRRGVACHVEGKDIGRGLLKLANRYSARSIDQLSAKLDRYLETETQKLIAKGKETLAESLADRVETLKVVMEGCKTVEELTAKIVALFQDSDESARPSLTLSTVHKAKGREWPRVFILGHSTLMPSKYARQEWEIIGESNIQYVAYTRAQQELVLVAEHDNERSPR